MSKSLRKNLKKRGGDRPVSPGQPEIPDKLYFKIGEVSEIAGVEPHVLRFWESEFKQIRPQRAASRQRLYRRVDVETILQIKKLLYEDGFTVPGARKFLAADRKGLNPQKTAGPIAGDNTTAGRDFYQEMKSELEALKKMLDEGE